MNSELVVEDRYHGCPKLRDLELSRFGIWSSRVKGGPVFEFWQIY